LFVSKQFTTYSAAILLELVGWFLTIQFYTMMEAQRGCRDIELLGSLSDNTPMGRPKNFSREEVLEKAVPVSWKHGFSDTSLQDLERATGVNKSGLYTEFRDKEDLFCCVPSALSSEPGEERPSHQGASWLEERLDISQEWSSQQEGTAGMFFRQLYAGVRYPSG
jgi:Bacterial regulatory proteins, tetR family